MTFDAISETAWLQMQFDNARLAASRVGHFLTRKEFLAKPGFTIALTPMALLEVLKAQIPFQSVVIAPSTPTSGTGFQPVIPGKSNGGIIHHG